MKVLYPTAALPGLITASTITLAILIFWCHRKNVKRIMDRTENKISFKKKEAAAPSEDEAGEEMESE